MEKTKELAVDFVQKAYTEYFINKNSDFIMKYCNSYDIPLLGLRATEWIEKFEIVSEHHHVDKLSDDIYYVSTRIILKDTLDDKKDANKTIIDGTFVCKYIGEEEFRLLGVQISGTDRFNYEKTTDEDSDLVYRKVLEYTYDVMFECDTMNNIFRYDPEKYKELFGFDTHFVSADQWFWHVCTESVIPQDTEKLDIFRSNDIIKRIRNSDYVIEDDIRIKHKERGVIWLKMVIVFIPNKEKTNLHKVFVMFKDIDAEKRKDLDYITKSRTDSLTGLYNREYTETEIMKFLGEDETNKGIFVILDIDEFKKVNDTFGHMTGDTLLKNTAQVLYDSVRNNDILGRIGGDEFVIFLKHINDEKMAKAKLANILNNVQCDHSEDGNSLSVRCSAGAVLTDGKNSFDEIYKAADRNLYESKAAGRNTFRVTSI